MVEALRRIFRSHSPSAGVIDEIKRFRALRPGWNSYRAPAISETAIKAALDIVEVAARRGAPTPSAAPTPLGGVALTWSLPNLEAQLLIDDESFDYSVARPGNPKVIDQGSVIESRDVERALIDRYLIVRA